MIRYYGVVRDGRLVFQSHSANRAKQRVREDGGRFVVCHGFEATRPRSSRPVALSPRDRAEARWRMEVS